jgi:hypothetical protein
METEEAAKTQRKGCGAIDDNNNNNNNNNDNVKVRKAIPVTGLGGL